MAELEPLGRETWGLPQRTPGEAELQLTFLGAGRPVTELPATVAGTAGLAGATAAPCRARVRVPCTHSAVGCCCVPRSPSGGAGFSPVLPGLRYAVPSLHLPPIPAPCRAQLRSARSTAAGAAGTALRRARPAGRAGQGGAAGRTPGARAGGAASRSGAGCPARQPFSAGACSRCPRGGGAAPKRCSWSALSVGPGCSSARLPHGAGAVTVQRGRAAGRGRGASRGSAQPRTPLHWSQDGARARAARPLLAVPAAAAAPGSGARGAGRPPAADPPGRGCGGRGSPRAGSCPTPAAGRCVRGQRDGYGPAPARSARPP